MNPTRRAELKAAVAAKKSPVAVQPAPVPPAAKQAKTPGHKEKTDPPKPTVTHCCGHTVPMGLVTSMQCADCRGKARTKRIERNRAKQAARGLNRTNDDDTKRLPDGAVYHKVYDAGSKSWLCSLEVTIDGKPRKLVTSGSGSFRSEVALDRMYREMVEQSQEAEKASAAGVPVG